MMPELDKGYWEKRWADGETGWDMGSVSRPLKEFIDGLTDKEIKILIPGCGNAHEAEYLWNLGFKNTFVVDISKKALGSFKKRFPSFPSENTICWDFFELTGNYDLILEQTFFCALAPSQRQDYAVKVAELLKPNGMLVGVLFDFPLEDGPPYGGNAEEYKVYFQEHFKVARLERCYNSIKPREGRELFVILRKLT